LPKADTHTNINIKPKFGGGTLVIAVSHFPVKVPLRGSIQGYPNKTKIKRLGKIIPPTTIY